MSGPNRDTQMRNFILLLGDGCFYSSTRYIASSNEPRRGLWDLRTYTYIVFVRKYREGLSSSISITMLFSRLTTAVALLASNVAATIYYAGVAESGGEFGVWSKISRNPTSCDEYLLIWGKGATSTPGTGLPGRFGVDYVFINKSAIDVFVDQNKVQTLPRRLKCWPVLIMSRSICSG